MNNSTAKKPKILFVASEAAPFAQAGGLGGIMHSLPLALKKLGQDVRLIIPRYGTINPQEYKLKIELKELKVPTDQSGPYPYLICNVKKCNGREAVPTYFLENMEYYEKRANVYGYSDDHIRWVLFCRGVLEFIKKSSWKPDIIVASDWQTGLIPNYLKTTYHKDPELSKITVIFAIHNLQYQGMCDFNFAQETERDSGQEPIPNFFNPRLAKLNWMLRGIMYSDLIATVSPTYAKEILTSEYGEGMDRILSEKREKIHGILNGISYNHYNPEKSPHIPAQYSAKSISKKGENKMQLQNKFGLPQNKEVFLIGMVCRFAEQKGFELLEQIMEPLFKNLPIQLVCVGEGESKYKGIIKNAMEKFPEKIGCFYQFDSALPHLIFAGADSFLMPSKFEPCGITQMQAMRYGCIPIARETGGLADTITNFIPDKGEGDGFLFKEYDPSALLITITKALTVFGFKSQWEKLVKRAMKKDFSWTKSAKEYIQLFNLALKQNSHQS